MQNLPLMVDQLIDFRLLLGHRRQPIRQPLLRAFNDLLLFSQIVVLLPARFISFVELPLSITMAISLNTELLICVRIFLLDFSLDL